MAKPRNLTARVDTIEQKLDRLSDSVDRRFEQVDQRFELVLQAIAAEGEKTRRHFDVTVEQIKAERDLVLDLGIANGKRLLGLIATNARAHLEFDARLTVLETSHE
ncbi:MAG: hypothetical protein ABIS06_07960 [Vicinamibacterales bacterium]